MALSTFCFVWPTMVVAVGEQHTLRMALLVAHMLHLLGDNNTL